MSQITWSLPDLPSTFRPSQFLLLCCSKSCWYVWEILMIFGSNCVVKNHRESVKISYAFSYQPISTGMSSYFWLLFATLWSRDRGRLHDQPPSQEVKELWCARIFFDFLLNYLLDIIFLTCLFHMMIDIVISWTQKTQKGLRETFAKTFTLTKEFVLNLFLYHQ